MPELTQPQIMEVLDLFAQSDLRIRTFDSEGNKGYFLIYGICYSQSTTEIYIGPGVQNIIETEMHSPSMVLTTSRRDEFDQRICVDEKSNLYLNLFFTTEKFLKKATHDKCDSLAIPSKVYREILEKYW